MLDNKKKICYFAGTHGDWGGASRVLFTTLRLLDRQRFEPIVLLTREGPATELLKEMDIRYEIWGDMLEFSSITGYSNRIFKTYAWLSREKIDVIHVNRATGWRPAEYLAAKLRMTPIITHFHTAVTQAAPYTRMSTVIAAVSQYVANASKTQGIPVEVIHNSVNIEQFSCGKDIRRELGIDSDDVVVMFAGQIKRIKGVDNFIKMAARLKGENVRFLIAGECRGGAGRQDAYTQDELQHEISIDPRIKYLGYRTDMPDIYRSSDIVVMPSRWEEPFGLIITESGAASRPIVATRVGGIPEVIKDKETGFIVDPEDVEQMARTVQKLIDSPIMRSKIGSAARQLVEKEFTTTPIRKLEEIYESL